MTQTPTALRWAGRIIAVGAVALGLIPDGDCGSSFFPNGGTDILGQACSEVVAGRQTAAIVLLVVGVAVMFAGQVIGWNKKP